MIFSPIDFIIFRFIFSHYADIDYGTLSRAFTAAIDYFPLIFIFILPSHYCRLIYHIFYWPPLSPLRRLYISNDLSLIDAIIYADSCRHLSPLFFVSLMILFHMLPLIFLIFLSTPIYH